jgi:hypothetical protein
MKDGLSGGEGPLNAQIIPSVFFFCGESSIRSIYQMAEQQTSLFAASHASPLSPTILISLPTQSSAVVAPVAEWRLAKGVKEFGESMGIITGVMEVSQCYRDAEEVMEKEREKEKAGMERRTKREIWKRAWVETEKSLERMFANSNWVVFIELSLASPSFIRSLSEWVEKVIQVSERQAAERVQRRGKFLLLLLLNSLLFPLLPLLLLLSPVSLPLSSLKPSCVLSMSPRPSVVISFILVLKQPISTVPQLSIDFSHTMASSLNHLFFFF